MPPLPALGERLQQPLPLLISVWSLSRRTHGEGTEASSNIVPGMPLAGDEHTSSRLATLAHAMSSTKPTDVSSVQPAAAGSSFGNWQCSSETIASIRACATSGVRPG